MLAPVAVFVAAMNLINSLEPQTGSMRRANRRMLTTLKISCNRANSPRQSQSYMVSWTFDFTFKREVTL